jgi:rSAM/selenodomain-associated transferase 2
MGLVSRLRKRLERTVNAMLSAEKSADVISAGDSFCDLSALSIVIPVYRDQRALESLLWQLKSARDHGAEIIVAGTHDDPGSLNVATERADRYVVSQRGRGIQLAAGAAACSPNRSLLWFLHADTQLPESVNACARVLASLEHHAWGRFDIAFDDRSFFMRLIAVMMNARSRLTGIATGDQGMFVRRDVYRAVGGFPSFSMMEDVALSRALLRSAVGGRPSCVGMPIITSARKWQRDGVLRTIIRMWWWRFRFWWGESPETLAKEYYRDLS